MHERRTPLESFWRTVAIIVAVASILSSSPVAFVVGLLLRDPVGQLVFFSTVGVVVAAVVIHFVVRSVNRHDDPRCVRLPDEMP